MVPLTEDRSGIQRTSQSLTKKNGTSAVTATESSLAKLGYIIIYHHLHVKLGIVNHHSPYGFSS